MRCSSGDGDTLRVMTSGVRVGGLSCEVSCGRKRLAKGKPTPDKERRTVELIVYSLNDFIGNTLGDSEDGASLVMEVPASAYVGHRRGEQRAKLTILR